jgi:hypothetical protein
VLHDPSLPAELFSGEIRWIAVSGQGHDSWLRQHPAEAAFYDVKQCSVVGDPCCRRIDSEAGATFGKPDGARSSASRLVIPAARTKRKDRRTGRVLEVGRATRHSQPSTLPRICRNWRDP